MTRIFFTLALFSVLLMLATLVVGLTIGDLTAASDRDTAVRADVHRIMGLAAALVVVLVNSIVVTYFIGTSRWCKEVVQTYRLDNALIQQSARLKRRTFPWTLGGMLIVVGVIALGGAADPMTGRQNLEGWDTVHLLAAFGGLAFILGSYVIQWNYIEANHRVINEVMTQVRQIRKSRGLDVEGQETTPAGELPAMPEDDRVSELGG